MRKWFKKQSKLIQCLLLLIPVVNWIVEILIRWEKALETKDLLDLVLAIVFTVAGLVFGYLDLIWVLLFDHLFLAK